MRFILSCIALLLFTLTANAQPGPETGPEGFVLWKSGQIEAATERLYKELGDERLVWEVIGNYPGHSMYLVLRGKTSAPELHETESDFQISMAGKATLLMGGELVDPEYHQVTRFMSHPTRPTCLLSNRTNRTSTC
jgi:hypothetical protein